MRPAHRKPGGSSQNTSEQDQARRKRDSGVSGVTPQQDSGVEPKPPPPKPWPGPSSSSQSNKSAERYGETTHQTYPTAVTAPGSNYYTQYNSSAQGSIAETPVENYQGYSQMQSMSEEVYRNNGSGTNGGSAPGSETLRHQQGTTASPWVWSQQHGQHYYPTTDYTGKTVYVFEDGTRQ